MRASTPARRSDTPATATAHPRSATTASYRAVARRLLRLDADADLDRPGIDEHAGEYLPSGETVYRAHVTQRQAEVADARDIDLDARVDAEVPERRRDRSI